MEAGERAAEEGIWDKGGGLKGWGRVGGNRREEVGDNDGIYSSVSRVGQNQVIARVLCRLWAT